MSELYLIFFAVGLLIFGGIVAYSVAQQRKGSANSKAEYVDPLFAELEQSKEKAASRTNAESQPSSSSVDTELADLKEPVEPSLSDDTEKSHSDAARNDDQVVSETSAKKAPRLQDEAVSDVSKQAQIVDGADIAKPAVGAPSKPAEVHAAELAPKPKIDRDSSTVVTELVARINNSEPIEQQGLLSLFRKHDFKFHRKVHIYGLNQLTDMWRDIEFELPSARFVELGISIQLADREGAMSQKELHDFQQMVLEFTNEYDAPFEFSMNIDDALKQALALDQIGRRYDSMAVLNVVPKSKSGFRMADIESCARDLMMSTDKNGIFMKTQGQKNNITVLFRLACTDGSGQFGISSGSSAPVHDLVVYMNVPATQDPEMVFQEMVKDANSLATWLEGKVVDRQGRAMSQRSYSVLMQQVSDIAFSMQQDGFTPGDEVAKKLF